MTDLERLTKLRAVASDLNIQIYAVGMTYRDINEISPTSLNKILGIDVVSGVAPIGFYYELLKAREKKE